MCGHSDREIIPGGDRESSQQKYNRKGGLKESVGVDQKKQEQWYFWAKGNVATERALFVLAIRL